MNVAPRNAVHSLRDEVGSAFSLLTTLPMRDRWETPATGRIFFPAVGLLLGALAWCALWAGSSLVDQSMGAFLAVAALVVLTGALHLDGFGDCADGLFGGSTVSRRLEIMRDSRVGAFGSVAIAMVLIGDVVALGAISRADAIVALLGAASMARLAMLALVIELPYARPQGLGNLVEAGKSRRDLLLALPVVALPIALDWRHGLIALGGVALTAVAFGAFARRRIGGATGDVYGGVLELSQLVALSAYAVRL